jgi:uncharacterized protein HemY
MVEALTIVVGSIISIVAVYIVVLDDNGVFASHACRLWTDRRTDRRAVSLTQHALLKSVYVLARAGGD